MIGDDEITVGIVNKEYVSTQTKIVIGVAKLMILIGIILFFAS